MEKRETEGREKNGLWSPRGEKWGTDRTLKMSKRDDGRRRIDFFLTQVIYVDVKKGRRKNLPTTENYFNLSYRRHPLIYFVRDSKPKDVSFTITIWAD